MTTLTDTDDDEEHDVDDQLSQGCLHIQLPVCLRLLRVSSGP